MLNEIVLMGRLTADPELKQTPNGVSVSTFTIAVDRDIKNQEGGYDVDFINIVAWRKLAEFVSQYFQKGQLATVKGRLQIRPYTDKNGNKRTVAEVVADKMYFAGQKPQQDNHGATFDPPHENTARPESRQTKSYSTGSFGFEDIPLDEDGDLPF